MPASARLAALPAPAVYQASLTTRFRGIEVRDGVLLHGAAGWGEFSPFWDYDDAECVPWLRAALEAAELGWPPAVRDSVPVNATVPAVGPAHAVQIVVESDGCRTAKVKVAEPGQTLADEQARLEAVRGALGPGGRIRIDANGAWDLDTALARLPVLDRAAGGLEYAEQPCASVADLAALRRTLDIPIAADESIRRAADPLAVRRAEAADVVVLKVQPLGGVRACLALAEEVGLPVVVSSALESSVGIAAGVALAAALPELPYACGLGTVRLLTADTAPAPLVPCGGTLPVTTAAPTPDSLAAVAAPPEVRDRWLRRLHDVAARTEATA
ncbi:o-succinylbenzoate synthase [Georgenia sunbinii]|uniref:o-succinylbenzoate synthase n=1 Tax=Georgenia sunbinii TaxID=3117728 RepID=UPI002F264EAE